MNHVSRAEFARLMQVNRSTVTRWIECGRIALGDGGLIDVAAARTQLGLTASPLPHHMARAEQAAEERQQRLLLPDATDRNAELDLGGNDGAADINLRLKLARAKREESEAEIAAMRRDEQARLLVQRADADYVMTDIGRTVGDLLDRMADRYTPALVGARGDATALHAVLSDAARDLRTEIAAHMRRRAQERL